MSREYKSFFSPSKINLFFKIVSKRNDGYHEIASLYQAIDLCDIIKIRISDQKDHFSCQNIKLSFDSDNLIYEAYEKFKKATKLIFFIDIHLIKNIPIEAGLGGGSSNAATVLWALNEIFSYPLSLGELKKIGSNIGSDVPFFLSRGISYCTGRGEVLQDVNSYIPFECYLVKPPFGMSTKAVYTNVDIDKLDINNHLEAFEKYQRGEIVYFNDLEKAAFKIQPKLLNFKQKLLENGAQAYMTGSGSSFFFFENLEKRYNKDFKTYRVKSLLRDKNNWFIK